MVVDAAARRCLRNYALNLPAGTAIPVLREALLDLLRSEGEAPPLVDLSVLDVATLLKRKASTVRGWCASGIIPGAYRLHGREWRVPQVGLQTLFRSQSDSFKQFQEGGLDEIGEGLRRRGRRTSLKRLSAWREIDEAGVKKDKAFGPSAQVSGRTSRSVIARHKKKGEGK